MVLVPKFARPDGFAMALPALATIFLAPDGSDHLGENSRDSPFQTLRHAARFASHGKLVMLAGVYPAEGNTGVTFRSKQLEISADAEGSVTIDCGGLPGLTLEEGDYKLKGVRWRGCDGALTERGQASTTARRIAAERARSEAPPSLRAAAAAVTSAADAAAADARARASLRRLQALPPLPDGTAVQLEAGSGDASRSPPPALPSTDLPPARPPPPPALPATPPRRAAAAVAAVAGTCLGAVVIAAAWLVYRRDPRGGGGVGATYASLAGSRFERQQHLLDDADDGRPPLRELHNAA